MNKIIILLVMFFLISLEIYSSEINPEAKKYFDNAYDLLNQGDISGALINYQKAADAAPDSSEIWMEYCVVLRKANHLQSAARAGWRAIELSPKNPGVLVNLGNVFMQAREWEAALKIFDEAFPLYENKQKGIQNIINIGYYQRLYKKYDAAINTLSEALKKDPLNPLAMVDLGITYGISGKKEQAKEWIIKAQNLSGKMGQKFKEYCDSYMNILNQKGKIDPDTYDKTGYQKLPERFLVRPQSAMDLKIDSETTRIYDFPQLYQVGITVPENWLEDLNASNQPPNTLVLSPIDQDSVLLITFWPNEFDEKTLKSTVELMAGSIVNGSVEQKIDLKPILGKNSKGFIFTFTDKSCLNRELQKGEYIYYTGGQINFGKRSCNFSFMRNNKDPEVLEKILSCLKKMEEVTA